MTNDCSFVATPLANDRCEPHTTHPDGYIAFDEWAEQMLTTHDQKRCPGCGLWAIWTPKEDAA